jgi:hypothetical protein
VETIAAAGSKPLPLTMPSKGGSKRANAAPEGLLPTSTAEGGHTVLEAAGVLGCNSESCVIAHPTFRSFVANNKLLPRAALDLELATRYKAEGPRSSLALLSNYNIDDTLHRWAVVFPEFFPCPFAMMDFDATGEPFAVLDMADIFAGRVSADLGPGVGLVRRPFKCFGCVVNTDNSSGPGKHWVAVFVDARPGPGGAWSVEYFNSAGRPPVKNMIRWMERTRARLVEYRLSLGDVGAVASVPVTDVDHQLSQTECGLYALYYIRCRLQGHPYTFFERQRIPDDAMTAFRAHVFRGSK